MRSNTKKRTLFQNYETEYNVLLFTLSFFFFRFFLFYLKWIDLDNVYNVYLHNVNLDNVYDSNILQTK